MDTEELAAANIWNMPRVAAMYKQAEAVGGSEHGRHNLVKGDAGQRERSETITITGRSVRREVREIEAQGYACNTERLRGYAECLSLQL